MSKNKVSRIGKTVGRNKTTKLEERETRYEKKSEEKRIGVKWVNKRHLWQVGTMSHWANGDVSAWRHSCPAVVGRNYHDVISRRDLARAGQYFNQLMTCTVSTRLPVLFHINKTCIFKVRWFSKRYLVTAIFPWNPVLLWHKPFATVFKSIQAYGILENLYAWTPYDKNWLTKNIVWGFLLIKLAHNNKWNVFAWVDILTYGYRNKMFVYVCVRQ